MINHKVSLLAALSVVVFLNSARAVEVKPESDAEFNDRMEWFVDARFGLFIHYGVYSTLEGIWQGEQAAGYAEWIQSKQNIAPEDYIPLAANFHPVNLDADAWVRTAKEAGMKYMVITAKHHEGFCLWDSDHTKYDLGEGTTFDRDILGELATACKKHGIKFGTYYSIIDWHHPSQRAEKALFGPPMRDKEGYVSYMKLQLKELIDKYDPAIMWFDGDWVNWWTMEDGTDLYNYLRELSPDMIINNRVAKRAVFKKDFGTPENSTPGAALDHIWEACWTINHSWGFKRHDTNWKNTTGLVRKLADINAKGGNLLLNVGPKPDGSWPEACTERLLAMGEWNRMHHDAIYNTDYINVRKPKWGQLTLSKGSNDSRGELFAYVFDWPKNGILKIEGIKFGKVRASTFEGADLSVRVGESGFLIDVSSVQPNPYCTVVRIRYSDGKETLQTLGDVVLNGNELILQAREAKLSGAPLQIENDSHIGYWTNPQSTATWNLNVPAPGTYAVKILYSCAAAYAGSEAKLTVDGEILAAKVESTGSSWGKYRLLDMGTMELNEVGTKTCTVGFGDDIGGALFNLKTILFSPVAE